MNALSRLAVPTASAAAVLALSTSLAAALPHFVAPLVASHGALVDVTEAETLACQVRSGRTWDDCNGETAGKALIRDAERAALPARSRDRAADARSR